jgi:hypothetical protein
MGHQQVTSLIRKLKELDPRTVESDSTSAARSPSFRLLSGSTTKAREPRSPKEATRCRNRVKPPSRVPEQATHMSPI